jgi:hypothetical protein
MNYGDYTAWLTAFAAENNVDAVFMNTAIPRIIDYAEQRIYRELDLLETRVRDISSSTTANSRNFTVPAQIVVVEGVNIATPAGSTPDSGTRNQLTPTTRDFLDAVYPNSSIVGVPKFFAMVEQNLMLFGPAADQAYTVEVIGTFRPAPLSSTNSTTFLSLYLPDLFMAASMIFTSGYQKNFSAISDTPAASQTWEAQYQHLLKSAYTEEARKKWTGLAWRSRYPDPTQTITPEPAGNMPR